ncbi:acetyl-CoA synthetase-like protein [Aspergillus campestris IBT 28561]|uniref:Acetyl-CoA synthetase-like protein n=1 Tax=Aspergillus campestris (strain IBT 28561) TaxID=1392248 RepID=A0A2I1D315_ASPC2|nr:acetyl-CoA synthetase-like protein [Aspergillus campestris IBT 28561]PKY04276.1 acetyl-CoA synthetase-like protein [Aspergillus campestris IBT 28561]
MGGASNQQNGVNADLGGDGSISQQDFQTILSWNKTYPERIERCAYDMFQETAQKQPNYLAICAWDGDLLYGELDQLATKLATQLIEIGLRPGTLIPICFEKSMWATVAMLGVLKAGRGFVMLDASLPEQRLQAIIRQVKATRILTSASNRALGARLAPDVIFISSQFFTELDVKADRRPTSVDPMSVMYVTFTSGSTGTPKGVMITHSNFASALYHQMRHLGSTPESSVYDFASYSFDLSIIDAFDTLVAGGCLCVPTEQDRTNRLAQSITSLRANVVFLTPSVARLLDPDEVPTLQTLKFGVEALSIGDVIRWWGKVQVINLYGPSECTPFSLFNCDASSPQEATRIGKGAGQVTWVVDPDDHDRLLPLGHTGELLLEGPLVGKGYLGDDEKTASTFIRKPVWLQREASDKQDWSERRLYKTGDLVKYNDDGSLTYVGRKDAQVKIHGQRVELGEIEFWLMEHMPEVFRVVADTIDFEGDTSTHVLAAFVQMNSDPVDTKPLKGAIEVLHLSVSVEKVLVTHLPCYMMPAVAFAVPELPMTVAGKLDRRKLRDLGTSCFQQYRQLQRHSSEPSPLPPFAKELQTILGRALALDPALIGLDDSFFRLGGDSIAAMRFISEARKAGIEMTVSDIFQNPTLGGLFSQEYRSVDEAPKVIRPFTLLGNKFNPAKLVEETANRYQIDRASIVDAYPCTPLQEGLFSLLLKDAGEYVHQRTLEIRPSIPTSKFCRAWETLVRNVAIMRTRIVQTRERGILQVVSNQKIQWIHTTGLDEYLKEDRKLPMELGKPLARYALITDPSSARRWFVWTLHHALYDGWSLPLTLDMVNQAYRGISIKSAEHEFNVFIEYIGKQNGEKMAEYWRNTLEGCDCASFPTLPSSVRRPVADSEVAHPIKCLESRSRDVTPAMLVRAAWSLLVSRVTNSDDVVFGITASGRSVPVRGIDKVVGPTIATFPLYVKIPRSQKVSHYLAVMQQQATEMIPFEQFGLHRIAKTCLGAKQACAFQTLLVIQPQEMTRADGTLGKWLESCSPEWVNTYALSLEVQLSANTVIARFDSRVIKPWFVQVLLEELDFVMTQLDNAGSEQAIGGIKHVSPQNLERVWNWNRSVPSPVNQYIHQTIEERIQSQPNASAISAWDGDFTYSELDRLATELVVAQLVESGVGPHLLGPDMLIPLCFEKSAWAVVAILGVLKFGAGFVLLDPSLPEPRLRSILHQVGSRVLLSSHANVSLSRRLSEIVVQIGPDLLQSPSHVQDRVPRHSMRSMALSPPSSKIMYAVFTSGSSGTPKGVLVTHASFCSAVDHQLGLLRFTRESRILDFASYAFDAAVHNVMATLVAGGCLCIPSEETRKNDLTEVISVMRPTMANLTPTVARLVDPGALQGLDTLILLGEPVTARDAERWRSHNVHFINTYGPAECTPISTINSSSTNSEEAMRIGKGVGLVTWIVDPEDHNVLMPPGCTGELLLEGPLVGKGYMNGPKKTVKAFIEDPKWLLEGSIGQPGRHGRLYKTADLARYNEDGSLSFVGRNDSQTKIRGQRIELEEVEHHILKCLPPEAIQVVVEVIVLEAGTNPRLVLMAFIQERTTAMQTTKSEPGVKPMKYPMAATIKNKLAQNLPSYMVPTIFLSVLELPLTATGETDRRRLREIGRAVLLTEGERLLDASEQCLEEESPIDGPILETEQPAYTLARKVHSLRSSWSRRNVSSGKDEGTTGLNNVPLQSAGLDSVDMMELTSFISQNFHVHVHMRLLMSGVTSIRSLAQYLVDCQASVAKNCLAGHGSTTTSASIDLMAEIHRHDARVMAARHKSSNLDRILSNNSPIDKDNQTFSVFLTGASGFIGTQILRQLLGLRHVSRVISLVRGETDEASRYRTVDAAVKALWWKDHHAEKLDVWRGDLSQPNLGLDPTRWDSLTGGQAANIIIHAGATVHWTKSYEVLEAANVGSTVELLLLANRLPYMRFLYITGGRPWSSLEEPDVVKELSVADAIPYSQTKLVAEAVVRRAAQRSPSEAGRLAVLNPSWVIGTPDEGVSNTSNYIWRLVATCIKIGAYNTSEADGWLFISDVATTATAIIDAALGNSVDTHVTDESPVDGITWKEIWSILEGLGYKLHGKATAEWLALVRADMDAGKETHPLWPLAHMIEGFQNDRRTANFSLEKRVCTPLRLKRAVAKSAEYLVRVGFLPASPGLH